MTETDRHNQISKVAAQAFTDQGQYYWDEYYHKERELFERIFTTGAQWADQNPRVTEEKLLAAFAKSLGVEDASGWSTGQDILKHIFKR